MGRGGKENITIASPSRQQASREEPVINNAIPSANLNSVWDANSPIAEGTPYTEQQLNTYCHHLLDLNHLKKGDVIALSMTNTSQLPMVEGLIDAAAQRGIVARVMVDPKGDGDALANQARQAVAENACYMNLQTFSPGNEEAIATPVTSDGASALAALDEAQNANQLRWHHAMWPSQEWANSVYPELEPEQAYQQLGQDLLEFARCAPGSTAWQEHIQALQERANILNELEVNEISLESEGTNLTMKVLPKSKFLSCDWETEKGDQTCVNSPTEEVFFTPDPESVNGHFTASKPLILNGEVITGIKGKFVDGRLIEIEASNPEHTAFLDHVFVKEGAVPGMALIGEIGLVDNNGPIAQKNRIYNNGIIDENAGVHFGMGSHYEVTLTELAKEHGIKGNEAGAHIDFIVGDQTMNVYGKGADGNTRHLISNGSWTF